MKASAKLNSVRNAGFGLVIKKEAIGDGLFWLYIYFLLDFFLHFAARIPGYGSLRPTLLLVFIISVALFANKAKLKGYGSDPITKALIALFIYIFLSVPLVEWPGSVIKNNLPEFFKAIVFFFFTSFLIDSERRLKIFLVVYVGCQVFRVLEPLYLHITTGYWGSATHLGHGEFAGRLAGAPADVINSNELGFVIVTALPYLHYLVFSGSFKYKLLYMALLPALLYAMILSMSRGALLAFLVIAWMIFKESKNKAGLVVLAIIILIGAVAVMNPVQKDRYFGIFGFGSSSSSSSKTLQGRKDLIIEEFMLGLKRPLFGHGLGTTPEAKANKWGKPQASHNMYGELTIEIGLIGLFFFVRYMTKIYQGVKYNRQLMADPDRTDIPIFYRRLNTTLICVFWMFVVYSLNYWGLSQYYWYLFGGLILAFARLVQSRDKLAELEKPESKPA